MIGSLNKRATLANPTNTKGTDGGNEVTYSDFVEAWCAYTLKDSSVTEEGAQKNMVQGGEVTLRYSSALAANVGTQTKITIEGKEYRVEGIKGADKRFIALKIATIDNGL